MLQSNKAPYLLVTTFGQGRMWGIDASDKTHALELSTQPLGGVYPMTGSTSAMVLEYGGDRLFRVDVGADGAPREAAAIAVGRTPRLLELHPDGERAWVICRDEREALREVALGAGRLARTWALGTTPSALALDAGGELLAVADLSGREVRIIAVDAPDKDARVVKLDGEPLRLVPLPTPGRWLAMASNSAAVHLIDAEQRLAPVAFTLDTIPSDIVLSPDGVYAYVVSAGAGVLRVVRLSDGALRQKYSVPVGSHDLAWAAEGTEEGRLVMSSGPDGALWIWRPEGENLRRIDALSVASAAGRVYVGPGDENVWLVSPEAGRASRLRVR